MRARRDIKLEEELRRLDEELNGPKVQPEEPKEPKQRPSRPSEKPPWAGPILLD